ncbi:shikimate 5-dehydrogenase [Kineococcus sp. NBC_00420]|uniref:shikimate 5-dehydrogenase n=1 Tax=Kineococcus sp. NBC_00420 TaxID=2903564 RepID=UPI002E2299C2
MLSKDTQVCLSLSGRPSNLGTRFHNFLYAELGLDFVYKAFTTTDLPAAIGGLRALGIRGAGISMPFKEAVIPLVDALDPSAAAIDSVNTIVNTPIDGVAHLVAHNTDYLAVAGLLATHGIVPSGPAAVLGSGGMAKASLAALRDNGFDDLVVVARNPQAGPALAAAHGARWVPDLGEHRPTLLLNATPVGMAGGSAAADLPVPRAAVEAADAVFEVVAVPEDTPFVRLGRELGKQVVTGTEVAALQAAEQFVLYTGVRPDEDQVRRAGEFSRATA